MAGRRQTRRSATEASHGDKGPWASSWPEGHVSTTGRLHGLRRRLAPAVANVSCLVVIILVATAFVAPALRPGHTLLPLQCVSYLLPWSRYIDEPLQNTALGDPFYAFYPRRLFFTESIRNREFPFWNPYVIGGYPAVGDTNAQTFYPPNWLAALLVSPARSFPVLALFHLALTGSLMFAMLRSYALHPASSLFGAVSWMLSGIIVVWLEHPHRLSSFAWLPGLFWAFNAGNQQRRLVFPVVGGLVFSLMILGGQPQYAALGGLLLAALAVSHCVKLSRGRKEWDWWPLVSLAVTALIGLGLGSLQLLPTYEFVAQSHRQPHSGSWWVRFAWPLRHVTTFWLPNLFGSAEAGQHPFWGGRLNYVEYTFYFGLPAFLLCLAAPVLSRQRRVAWLWSAIAILTTLAALGSPLAHLVKWIPGMSYFLLHRVMSHVPFLGSWLAALALDAVIHRTSAKAVLPWLSISGAALLTATGVTLYACRLEVQAHWDGVAPELLRQGCVFALTIASLLLMRKWRRAGMVSTLLVCIADLFLWGWHFNPVSSLDLLYPENEVTGWLARDTSLYRVLPLRAEERIFGENVLSVFHISTPDGYLALTLRHHKELMYTIDPYFEDESRRLRGPHPNLIVAQEFDPLHSILNVKYVLSSKPLEAPQLNHAATLGGVYVYENQDVLPRAYLVHRAEVVPEDQVLESIVSPGWNFRTSVLLSTPLTQHQQIALSRAPEQSNSRVEIAQYAPNRVQLIANMADAGLLVLADPFYAGWHATVDGRPAEVLRANHALRALFVEPGEHYIEFSFWPRSLTIGLLVACLACLTGLALIVTDLRCPRPSKAGQHGPSNP